MFKIYLLNSVNHPTKIYDDINVYNPIVFEPELDMNGDNGILVGKLTFKLHDPSMAPQLRLLQNTVIVTQTIVSVETVIFRGRPLLRDDDEYNDQDFTFEGILSGLNDTLQSPSNKRGVRFFKHFINIMDWHNNNLGDYANNRQIDYSKITSEEGPVQDSYMYTITEQDPVGILWENMLDYTRYRASTMDHLKTQYVDAHGGFFYLENEPFVLDANGCVVLHNYLKYVDIYNPDQAHINEQRIEFGKNLISIKRSASAADFATVLIPLGKQLTDVEKSWPYYQSTNDNKVRKITYSPDEPILENFNTTGGYINSETGRIVTGIGSAYVILNDVNVEPGEVFYLTTYLEGFSTDTSVASYVILDRDTGSKVFSIGSSVRNSRESGGTVTVKNLVLKDERIEIPTPEDDTIQLKLRTAYMISANDPNGGYVLKKLNKNYKEDNVTIMSAAPQTTGVIRKNGQHPIGRDVYPDATTLPTDPEIYEIPKRLVNQDLFDIFGPIEKSVELPDYGFDKLDDLIYWASKDLEKMGEDLEIEIQAADLGYIDERNEFFHPYDLVPVYSEPHGIDMMLPIVKMTLPLADPAAAVYTLQNDIHLSEESKKYISQMVSTPGSTGQKNQTVIIYSGGGSSGGGGGGEVPVRELPEVTAADNGKVLGVVNGQWAVKEDETGDGSGGSDIDPLDIYRTAFTTKSNSTQRNITNGNNVQITGQVLADLLDENYGGCKLLEIDTSNNTEAAYEVDEVTSISISFYRIADGKRHVITVPLNSNQGTYSVSDVVTIPEQDDELPTIDPQTDEGKVLGIVNGEWAIKDDDIGDTIQSDWEQTDTAADDYIKNKCNSLTALLYNATQQTISDKNGLATGAHLVQDYFQQSQLTNHLMYVYDWSGNVYHLHSVNRDTNEIKFKRRVGNVDTYLTLTGNSTTVVKSTESISGSVDASSVILTLDSNRYVMNGNSTITGTQIKDLVAAGKSVCIWDAANNRMFQYVGVGAASRPTFVSVWGDTQYRIAVYDNSSSTDETTSSLPLLPVPTHADVGKALVVQESNNEQFYALRTLPSLSNALIYDTQSLTDEQKLQSRKNLGLYGATVIFLYDGTRLTTLSRSDGIQSANTIVNNYYGNNTTILDHNFLFVYDSRHFNYYIFETFNTYAGENNYRVVFRRREGMYDKYLTLVGDSTDVLESSRKIDVDEVPDVIFYRHYLADKYSEDGTTILFHENSITAFQGSGAEVAISGNAVAARILSGTAVYIIDSGDYTSIYVPFYIQNYVYVAFRSTDVNGNVKLLFLNWGSSIAEVRTVQALPGVSSSDNGKILGVVNGQWAAKYTDKFVVHAYWDEDWYRIREDIASVCANYSNSVLIDEVTGMCYQFAGTEIPSETMEYIYYVSDRTGTLNGVIYRHCFDISLGIQNGNVSNYGVIKYDAIQQPTKYDVWLNDDGTLNRRSSLLTFADVDSHLNDAFGVCLRVHYKDSIIDVPALDKALVDSDAQLYSIIFSGSIGHADGSVSDILFALMSITDDLIVENIGRENSLYRTDDIVGHRLSSRYYPSTKAVYDQFQRKPDVVWEVADVSQGLLALNTNISSNLAWQLTNLDMTPYKRIKIYSRAGRKTGAIAQDSSITPASIIEMSLDNRAMENVSQNVFIGSSVVQNPNDQNRLGILTCAVSADKTKFAVVRATTLYGTAATNNNDAYPRVFMIEGYYD